MCKIIAFTDTKKINLKNIVNDVGNTLLKTEQDGFGYAVKGKSGVFGEKTIAPKFRTRLEKKSIMLPIVKKKYLSFGLVDELTGPGIFHGRTATSSDGLVNTHPMQRPDADGIWHLIHNGVVTDLGPQYSKLTDNDSEDVLFRLMEGTQNLLDGKADNPMLSVETYLEGYYAFACIDPGGRLHIARDGYATLYMAWSDTLNTFIIATTEGLILKLNKMLDAKIGPIDEVEDDVYMIFDGNELVYHQFINPLGFTKVQASKATASLGRELSPQATADLGGCNRLSTVSLNGGEVIVRNTHHRPTQDEKSEAEWQNEAQWDETITNLIEGQDLDRLDNEEREYYEYRREIDNLTPQYTIMDENDNYILLHDFYKLDHISQEQCTIIRPDGSVVEVGENLKYMMQRA